VKNLRGIENHLEQFGATLDRNAKIEAIRESGDYIC